jgi:hypothetical protein
MLERMRWRLTLGYAGIFAVILLFLSAAAVFGFSRELTNQQDVLLEQEAKDQAKNLLDGDDREILAEGSAEFSWVALDPDGRVTSRDPTAAALGTLGLPSQELAEEAFEDGDVVSATIRGPQGGARVVSMPMREDSGEVVGVSSTRVPWTACGRRSAGSSWSCFPWYWGVWGRPFSAVCLWPVGPCVRRASPSRGSGPSSPTPPTN